MASGNDFTHEFPLNVEHENFDARERKITNSNANAIFVFFGFLFETLRAAKNSVSLHLKVEKREIGGKRDDERDKG